MTTREALAAARIRAQAEMANLRAGTHIFKTVGGFTFKVVVQKIRSTGPEGGQ